MQALAARMKSHEERWCGERLGDVYTPVVARIDGRHFHAFTRGMKRPYDRRFSALMREVTERLVDETGAVLGYTQSDEISLVWIKKSDDQQIFFDGREHKMVSQLAALATCHFLLGLLPHDLDTFADRRPTFDARVFTVPTVEEAANYLVWRTLDAVRNSVNMLGQAHFSYRQLLRLNADAVKTMLLEKGVVWDAEPWWFKRGSYFQRRAVNRAFTAAEIEALPPKHHARTNPDLVVERTDVVEVHPPLLNNADFAALLRGENTQENP